MRTVQTRVPANRRSHIVAVLLGTIFSLLNVALAQSQTTVSTHAYNVLNSRAQASQQSFYIYLDQDSGFNHGFPSGFFASNTANLGTIHIDTGCIDDANATNGCSIDPTVLDRTHGTVLRISFDAQTAGNFAGVNIEEPENWGVLRTGTGYDLRGATSVTFDARSPNGAAVQFGVGLCVTGFMPISQNWTTISVSLSTLVAPTGQAVSCPTALDSVHVLFTVATNDVHAPNGATVLLDNVQFSPIPTTRQSALGFPLGNQSFGVLPQQNAPFPPDQVLRNLTTIYESALTELVLLARGSPTDIPNAKLIADTFDYALHHDSHGDPLPVAPDGSVGLHNGYEDGDIALFNNQQPPKQGQAGDIRLAGFTATTLCAPSGFCLVLDGATGGNNAFAILALVAAYDQFADVRYLNDAVTIGTWIVGNLTDATGTGYGGYFLGYPDLGVPPPKPLQTGKSIENNADVFSAFTALAAVEVQLGSSTAAGQWTAAANVAGDFVMQMFDSTNGRFNVGTVPAGTTPAPGICPTGPQKGNDVINVCDFLDSNTFTTLALAGSARYQSQIDWRRPIQFMLNNFAQTVTAAGITFQGFDIVPSPVTGPNGVAWEFTGQAVEAMRIVDQLYSDTRFEASANSYVAQIAQAQTSAPFGDGLGLVAATVQNGDTLPPPQQCIQTPFQCITERVGLAATNWAILAEQKVNVFNPFPMPGVSPTNLTFPNQLNTTTSAAQVVTLSNTGALALAVNSITATGDFAVSPSGTTCSTTSELPAGANCIVSLTFTPTTSGNRSGTLSIKANAAGSPQMISLSGTGTNFSVSVVSGGSTSATVSAGQSATFNLQVNPLSGFTGSVSISCSEAPAQSICTPSVSSVNVSGASSVPFSIAVTTTARGLLPPSPNNRPAPPGWILFFAVAVLSLILTFVMGLKKQAERRRYAWAYVGLFLVCLASLVVGCGGGSTTGGTVAGTPAGTYTLSVTGSDQGVQGQGGPLSLSLTVN